MIKALFILLVASIWTASASAASDQDILIRITECSDSNLNDYAIEQAQTCVEKIWKETFPNDHDLIELWQLKNRILVNDFKSQNNGDIKFFMREHGRVEKEFLAKLKERLRQRGS